MSPVGAHTTHTHTTHTTQSWNCLKCLEGSHEEYAENPFAGGMNSCWVWKCDELGHRYGMYTCMPPNPINGTFLICLATLKPCRYGRDIIGEGTSHIPNTWLLLNSAFKFRGEYPLWEKLKKKILVFMFGQKWGHLDVLEGNYLDFVHQTSIFLIHSFFFIRTIL